MDSSQWACPPPDAHASTYVAQINKRQLKCVDFNVFISDSKKVLFVVQMDKIRLFQTKLINDYDDTLEKQ